MSRRLWNERNNQTFLLRESRWSGGKYYNKPAWTEKSGIGAEKSGVGTEMSGIGKEKTGTRTGKFEIGTEKTGIGTEKPKIGQSGKQYENTHAWSIKPDKSSKSKVPKIRRRKITYEVRLEQNWVEPEGYFLL